VARWVYRIVPTRPEILDGATDDEAEAVAEHLDYQAALKSAGILIMAGPTDVAAGLWGVTLFEAPDEATAYAVMQTDPAVARGVVDATLYPYAVATSPDPVYSPDPV
jgi:uncharacterized protein